MIVYLASHNTGKARQLEMLLKGVFEVRPLPEDVELPYETGSTYHENALLKARAVVNATGRAALADDSGLEVSILGRHPGVRSARFAGDQASDDDNNAKLLALMENVPDESREAEFVSVLCLLVPGREPVFTEGRVQGRILRERRGAGGFGYDPIFYHPGTHKTFAEMTPDEKNDHSHRGRSARALLVLIERGANAGMLPEN